MSEISIEEHIKELRVMNSLWGMTSSQRRAVEIAISDMEKLKKIKEVLFRRSDIKTEEQAKASMVVKFMEIEQIINE